MPELPEVETMVRGVRGVLEGRVLAEVELCDCRCKPIHFSPELERVRELVVGESVTQVRRRAKRVVMQLANGWAFVIEPRMTGLMLVADPPDREHLRVRWRLRRGRRGSSVGSGSNRSGRRSAVCGNDVWFWDRRGLGTVKLLDPEELELELGPSRLGPDALEMTVTCWGTLLSRTRRAVKVALLDQKLVAGIGNLYASEILHIAGIHPETVTSELSSRRIARLHAATIDVLSEAIRYEGSTLGDGTYRNVLNQDGGYQNQHRVYGRKGERCRSCGRGRVRRIVQAQRSTFFCPCCQRQPKEVSRKREGGNAVGEPVRLDAFV
jgi:formamidopyrimidine-DNA glycosylase